MQRSFLFIFFFLLSCGQESEEIFTPIPQVNLKNSCDKICQIPGYGKINCQKSKVIKEYSSFEKSSNSNCELIDTFKFTCTEMGLVKEFLTDKMTYKSCSDLPIFDISYSEESQIEMDKILKKAVEEVGLLMPDFNRYFKGEVTFQGKTQEMKIRLKGHHKDSHPNDLRIKLEDDGEIFGFQKLNLQPINLSPNEAVIHRHINESGLLSSRMKLVNLRTNGVFKGIYYVEEHFKSDTFMKAHKRPNGPIIAFDENLIFGLLGLTQKWRFVVPQIFDYTPFLPFGEKSLRKDDSLVDSFLYANSLLLSYYHKKWYSAEDIFDVKKLAKTNAFISFWRGYHSLGLNNVVFYYNHFSRKIEYIISETLGLHPKRDFYNDDHGKFIWGSGPQYRAYFLEELKKLKEELESGDLIKKLNNWQKELFGSTQIVGRLKTKPYTKKMFLANLNYLLTDGQLTHEEDIHVEPVSAPDHEKVFWDSDTKIRFMISEYKEKDDRAELYLTNYISENVTITSIQFEEGKDSEPREILNRKINLSPGEQVILSVDKYLSRHSHYHVYALPGNLKEVAYVETYLSSDPLLPSKRWDLAPSSKNFAKKFPEFMLDAENKTVTVREGSYHIKKNLVLPKGYCLVVEGGATLYFHKDKRVYIQGCFKSLGTKNKKVIFSGLEGETWKGVHVVGDGSASVVRNSSFSDISFEKEKEQGLFGALTFYESFVVMTDVSFQRISTEKALSFGSSELDLNQIKAPDFNGNGMDFLFSHGTVDGVKFH